MTRGGSFDPREYLQLIKSRWPLIALVCAVTTALGYVHYSITPKLFRAAATIRIEQRSTAILGKDSNPWLEAWASVKYYPTQYRLLKSRGLAERVARDLGLIDDPLFNPAGVARSDDSDGEADPLAMAAIANNLGAGLNVDPIEGTELVALEYVSSRPDLAARIANSFAETFIRWEEESREASVGKAARFLTDEIRALRAEVTEKESQLQELGRTIDVVNLDPEAPGTSFAERQLTSLNEAYAEAIAARLEKETAYRHASGAADASLVSSGSVALISELRDQKLGLEADYQRKLKIYKPDWPDMVELKTRIDDLDDRLSLALRGEADQVRRRAYSDYETALRRERALQAEIQKLREDVIQRNPSASNYQSLQTELMIRKDLLDRLLRQLTETGVSASLFNSRDSNIRIVDRALPPSAPFRPSLRNDIAVGVIFGLILGVGLVLLLHLLDRTVKSAEELEGILGLPVLAVVQDLDRGRQAYGRYRYGYGYGYGYGAGRRRKSRPPARPDQKAQQVQVELVPSLQPRLAISEAYRSLRTALLLSSADELKVISITSAEASEGKTATAINLALVMAQLGRKVLLVDADLRKPRLHRVLGVSNRSGLVTYLTEGSQHEPHILATEQAGLHFCPSGPHPPNPSELLSSARMAEFLTQARTNFDFVILDSPPVLAVTDAIVIGSMIDGCLLCFRANKVLREDVKTCRDRLLMAEVKILGALLNRYRPTGSGYYSRRYQYYESYAETMDESADSAA